MFNPFNPYSPITEEKFFFGEKRIEEAINMAGQIEKNGYSYVVLAGDKMGKTSFLIRLNDILQRISLKKPGLLTLYVNLSHMMPLTPYNFLQGILSSTLKELKRDSEFNELQDKDYRLREGDDIKSLFDDFIDHKLKYLLREGEEVYGKIRLVLLIDDGKHLVTGQEWSEAMYHQLRYLFVDSPLSSKICSVMTGFRKIRDLRDRVGSPFNHMQSRFLEGFSEKDCRLILEKSLINSGKGEIDLKEDLLSKIHNLTGGHPFILTNLYSLLWDKIPPLNMFTIDETIEEIHTLESNFQRWNQKLDAYDREIYSYLIKQKDWIEGGYFKDKFKSRWRDSIEVLSSMSLINNMRKDNNIYYNTTFSLFREWFVNFFPLKEITEEQMEIDKQIPPSGEKNIKFFVYKNGIRNILKIDHCRKIIEEAYKKTGSFNFVIDRVFSEGSII
ncbi:MAG TPA: hypothetical protein PL110_04060, partial [Candidatus Eremiobacteraeota bacterium]|nr:hypothetical protein [Candidatus Eremiobacteraeota bacterium]